MIAQELDWGEVLHAAIVGVYRNVRNIKRGWKPKYNQTTASLFGDHILGCLGECAFAKWKGDYWTGVSNKWQELQSGDVGGFEVRAANMHHFRMLMHPGDHDDRIYILATIETPEIVHIQGWKLGRDCKREEWWDEPRKGRACFCVPQANLEPMETFNQLSFETPEW